MSCTAWLILTFSSGERQREGMYTGGASPVLILCQVGKLTCVVSVCCWKRAGNLCNKFWISWRRSDVGTNLICAFTMAGTGDLCLKRGMGGVLGKIMVLESKCN